MNDLDLCLDVV